MEKFKEFELESAELIMGGELIVCLYKGRDGVTHEDLYDTDTGVIVYFPPTD